jgi:hypothetical protein
MECWDYVILIIKKKDTFKKHDFCGKVLLDLTNLPKNVPIKRKVNLDYLSGKIELILTAKNFGIPEDSEIPPDKFYIDTENVRK